MFGNKAPEIEIKGFEKLFLFTDSDSYPNVYSEWKLDTDEPEKNLIIYREKRKVVSINIEQKVIDLNRKFGKQNEKVPVKNLSFDGEDQGKPFRIIFQSISKNAEHYYFEGLILF